MKKIFLLTFVSFSVFAQSHSGAPELFDYCQDMPLDTAVKVDIPNSRTRTTEQKYTIVRADEKTYDIYLNLQFKASRDFDRNLKGQNVNDFYKKKMNSCYRELEKYMVDEFGRKLRLHVYSKEEHARLPSAPPKVKIKVEDMSHRSHSRAYNSQIDCPTILHETFHLLGLVDEYEEKWMGFNHSFISLAFRPFVDVNEKVKPAFDCRAVGPSISLMHNQRNMYWGQSLYSGHVNAVIYPNCMEKNKKYYTCAKYAYRTSKKNNGAMVSFSDCSKKVPDYCKTPDWIKIDNE